MRGRAANPAARKIVGATRWLFRTLHARRRSPCRRYGALLAPYLTDASTLVVVSSDFCHWGRRFRFTSTDPSHCLLYTSPSPRDS